MNLDEFAFVNQQLAAMLRDGIPLEGALRQLCEGVAFLHRSRCRFPPPPSGSALPIFDRSGLGPQSSRGFPAPFSIRGMRLARPDHSLQPAEPGEIPYASRPFDQPKSQACWLTAARPEALKTPHADRHLERQFDQAANR